MPGQGLELLRSGEKQLCCFAAERNDKKGLRYEARPFLLN